MTPAKSRLVLSHATGDFAGGGRTHRRRSERRLPAWPASRVEVRTDRQEGLHEGDLRDRRETTWEA